MQSRWSDVDAQDKNDLDLLVYASRLIGAETTLVVWGGGNTSVKREERDHRGRPTRVLRVKGSGSDLKSIQSKDFPGVRMEDVTALLERRDMGDQEMVDYLAHALQEPSSPRPSISRCSSCAMRRSASVRSSLRSARSSMSWLNLRAASRTSSLASGSFTSASSPP